jgi:glycine/D-amino acid oxidase-like deaminating enzyme
MAEAGSYAQPGNAVAARVEREQIACHFRLSSRVILLRNEAERRALEAELELRVTHLGHRHRVLEADELGTDNATGRYVAAAVVEDLASIHPGLYVQDLARTAAAAGATLVGETEVLGLAEEKSGVRVATSAGSLQARHVLVATNGLTGRASPWHRRRIVPFDAYMIATEELPEATLNRLLPRPHLPRGRSQHRLPAPSARSAAHPVRRADRDAQR